MAALVVYLAFAGNLRFEFDQTPYAHHLQLADAFLHGQLHLREERVRQLIDLDTAEAKRYIAQREQETGQVVPPAARRALIAKWVRNNRMQDWSVVEGKAYGYWGPLAPALLVPVVAVFGPDASDRLIGAPLGALAVFLFALVLHRVRVTGLLPLTGGAAVLLTAAFAFGTVHFYLSCAGRIWFAAQLVALDLLLLGTWVVLPPQLTAGRVLLSGALFGAAFLARNFILFAAGFFAVQIAWRCAARRSPWSRWALHLVLFAVPVALAGALQAAYNAARFGNPMESGLVVQLQTGAEPRFRSDHERYALLSIHYLPRNLWYYLGNFSLPLDDNGHRTFDPEGNSLLLVTPLAAYALLAWRARAMFLVSLAAGLVPFVGNLLIFLGTGAAQFGNRYLLEVMPWLLLLVGAGMGGRVTALGWLLTWAAIGMNLWGTSLFCLTAADPLRGPIFWIVGSIIAAVGVVGAALLVKQRRPAA